MSVDEIYDNEEMNVPDQTEEISRWLERDARRYNRAFREAEEAGI